MIKSDAQLTRTKAQIDGFKRQLNELEARTDLPEEARKLLLASNRGMIEKLAAEIHEYEDAKGGVVRLPRLTSPRDLGMHLVTFRIAQGITQGQLAEMVGTTRQTINKHEEQEYQLASVDFISRVSEALGLLPEIMVKHRRLEVRQPALA
jgi:hypothetical protein